jgi:hypothetical protein
MSFRLQIAIVAIVVTTIALAPSLTSMISSHAQTTTTTTKIIKCEDEKGKTHKWITGCRDGWYEWDVCGIKDTGTGQYYVGYEAGWKKGQERNPNAGPNDCK